MRVYEAGNLSTRLVPSAASNPDHSRQIATAVDLSRGHRSSQEDVKEGPDAGLGLMKRTAPKLEEQVGSSVDP